MTNKKEMTAPYVSVGADTEQSIQKYTTNIIPDVSAEINEIFLKGGVADGRKNREKLPID